MEFLKTDTAIRVRGNYRSAGFMLGLAVWALPAAALGQQAQPEQQPPAAAPGQAPEGSVGGMGDVNLYPKRVVLTDRDRTATIGLYNRADATGDYDITITDMTMLPDGRLVDLGTVNDPAVKARVKTATSLLRWSPHRVTLPANEAQLVRIMVRVPPDLPPGEYRSHFSAIAVPPQTGGISIEQATGNAPAGSGVGVTIMPRFGIAIPIIVRVGDTTLTSGLKDIQVARTAAGEPVVRLVVTRAGTRSSFGNIAVTSAGSKKPIAEIKGIGVYPEIDQRSVQIPIDQKADPALYARGAKLTVTYTDDDFAPGQTLAKEDFVVP
ncbi:MAG: hypothetical protein KGL48_02645 [Sphingomonadales bacterium]|nr:hypothetical protein [Sphingomonadales bacterium]MDE2568433.1 hypothetical protein [Sphingomonadales bacterium]